MNKVLFITYDFHEEYKPPKSIAVATLESYINEFCSIDFVDHHSFNMNDESNIMFKQTSDLLKLLETEYDFICISLYSWSTRFIDRILDIIRDTQKNVKVIAGGYEVNTSNIDTLIKRYEDIDHFIIGYAETALAALINMQETLKIIDIKVENNMIPQIYENRIIGVCTESIVRLETKRGCPYNCSFCSYKNNDHNKCTTHNFIKVKKELNYLNQIGVRKVNVLDPIFTIDNYLELLEYLIVIDFKPVISFQVKFELFHGLLIKSSMLLPYLKKLNVILEFGLQTISKIALDNVERIHDLEKVSDVIARLNADDIEYEVSIIRGLPGETIESYIELLEYLKTSKCRNIVAFPLTILSNTELDNKRDELGIKTINHNGLEYIYESYSFNYKDYLSMIREENALIAKKILL